MRIESVSGLFLVPSDLYTDLEDPDSRKRYKELIQSQRGYSDEKADEIVAQLRKKEYWQEKSNDVLVVVTNENNERAFQIGFLLGYDFGKFYLIFTDRVIKMMREEEIAFIEKSKISPEAEIGVEFLDENWQEMIREGKLVGYEKTENRKEGEPYGSYVVEVDGEVQKIEDLGAFTSGAFRFLLRPSERTTSSITSP